MIHSLANVGLMFGETPLAAPYLPLNTDSVKISARLAKKYYPAGELKSTVWGYGIQTTPEIAAFVGSCMVRHHDNNSEGMHETDQVPAILAIGEALHSSGTDVLTAMTLFWEVFTALIAAKPGPGAPGVRHPAGAIDNTIHAPATAMALMGKLLGLNDDQMANAIALSLTGHIALRVEHLEGVNSMSKSNHDAELARAGVFAALQAREGMTGPHEIFEGKMGFMDVVSGKLDVVLPAHVGGSANRPLPPGDNRYAIETVEYKRIPGNSSGTGFAQIVLTHLPEYRNLGKVEDIESIEMIVRQFGDGEDPAKWDPLNSETADHSPYALARALLDGELWEGSYAKEKLTDPAVRAVMKTMTLREDPANRGNRFTVRMKSGAELTKGPEAGRGATPEEVHKKFDRNCAYRGVTNEQRDRVRATWSDLRKVKDIVQSQYAERSLITRMLEPTTKRLRIARVEMEEKANE